MLNAQLTKSQASKISKHILCNCNDAQLALNSKYSVTSTRATFLVHDDLTAELYSNYTHENVINEIPAQYREMFK
jgi:hypothetical protein